jgi:hypothetical protein
LLDRDGVSFFPLRPIAPLSPLLWIEPLAAELSHELLRMLGVGETVDVPPSVFMKDRVTARAERQVIAERANDVVAAIERHGPAEESSPLRYTMPN